MPHEYLAEELLPLSGIQHFLFCRRQWALIHVENQWKDNLFTVEGHFLHEQVDDPFFTEARPGRVISRSVPVSSYTLGIIGKCDAVEFVLSSEGVSLPGREGRYRPAPVEYKRGRPKRAPVDEAQLCAQALCLEEMLSTEIPNGYLYYGQTRHREVVPLTTELRSLVKNICMEMHEYFRRKYTPRVKITKACGSCSLREICIPSLQGKRETASEYIAMFLKSL